MSFLVAGGAAPWYASVVVIQEAGRRKYSLVFYTDQTVWLFCKRRLSL
jgi:hypothetical protein